MTHLDILLPFSLPQPETARDLIRECEAPALAMLLARSREAAPLQQRDPFSRALPHEHWLADHFDLAVTDEAQKDERGCSPAAAAPVLRAHLKTSSIVQGYWFLVQPAHIHVARDHLVLANIEQLELSDTESRRLFASAAPLCEEIGHTLLYVDAVTWLLRADDWAGLLTSTPQAASGRNVDIWMPEGPGELAWRKLQNEIQMQWFSESLNDEREMHGKKQINSLWIWGGADVTAASRTIPVYHAAFRLKDWMRTLPAAVPSSNNFDDLLAASGEHALLVLDALTEPALTNEWGFWLQRLETLDRDWFFPVLQALRRKRFTSLSLVLTGQDKLQEVCVTASSLRKFWVTPSLSKLAI